MFSKIIEYREMQQLRKDHLAQKKMRQALIFFGICVALLLVMSVVDAMKPAPVKPVKHSIHSPSKPAAFSDAQQQELDDIKQFAVAVTKPLETLDQDDLDLVQSKAGDPCYENNTQLPADKMVVAISACKLTPKGR